MPAARSNYRAALVPGSNRHESPAATGIREHDRGAVRSTPKVPVKHDTHLAG